MLKILVILVFYFLPCTMFAQQNAADSSQSKKWSFSAVGQYNLQPNAYTYIGYADHKALHLEARYNYEALKTGSAFAGWRFETGKKFQFSATPMLGLAFGNTNGFVPALELAASLKIFDFYSESEYIIDFKSGENNFFYTSSELAVSPLHALRTGIAIQRTHLYQTKLDTQRGIFAEYSFWKLTAGMYYYNPFSSDNVVIASLSIDF